MKLRFEHKTRYQYEESVNQSIQYLRLTPRNSGRQKIKGWQVSVPGSVTEMTDAFNNVLQVMTIEGAHQEIEIVAGGQVSFFPDASENIKESLSPYVFCKETDLTEAGEGIEELAEKVFGKKPNAVQCRKLMRALDDQFELDLSMQVDKPAAETILESDKATAQDLVHVFVACCRHVGLPARYVSGYHFVENNEQGEHDVRLHAWVEVWLMDQWLPFDPALKLDRLDKHLKLAVGLDYQDACPVRGIRFGGGLETLSSIVTVDSN